MNLAEILSQGLELVGTFSPKIVVLLFLACFIGEAAVFFVPYLLEATWLMAGVQLSQGVLSPPDLALLLGASMAGRQTGALILYFLSRSGSKLLIRYKNRFLTVIDTGALPTGLLRKMDILASPFSVALGRLLWLRIPLTLILGAKRKLKLLVGGIAISSLLYDGIYVALGAIVGTTAELEPARLVMYSLAGLTAVYAVVFAARRLTRVLTRRYRPVEGSVIE